MPDFLTSSVLGATLSLQGILLCTAVSLVLGFGIALIHMVKNTYSKGFVVALALLPAIVQIVIMMVNGNIGTGVAVAGAFSLVRFRSVPGSARDIVSIFFAMAVGLATGMGYLFFACLFLVLVGCVSVLLFLSKFGEPRGDARLLRITIPENLDYDGLFDDLFDQYLRSATLDRVKTTNMGSLYELSYSIEPKNSAVPKAFIDALRCRNGNLNIIVSRPQSKEQL
ncbi:DUF4956 domain-containing protein [Oscillospiraceae bacterium OttesenSCG-928-F05]|nr:DUF4956 domain-containing protein [Oscillospiraceae bacterium OttesenSCG-928-F05]